MYDRGLGVLEQYGLTAETVLRGRGALICQTEKGWKSIREDVYKRQLILSPPD